MRNITKILLLLIVAFVVYLLWPRTASLRDFNPDTLAQLEVEGWKAQKKGNEFDILKACFKIYASQYHFAPISAFRIAQNQEAALKHLKISREPGSDPSEENRSLSAFTEKYTWIKKQSKGNFNADALAREEFGWHTLELDGAPASQIAAPLSRVFAGLYGGASEDFMDVAMSLVEARLAIFSGTDGGATSVARAREAYSLLKEIAATPPHITSTPQ